MTISRRRQQMTRHGLVSWLQDFYTVAWHTWFIFLMLVAGAIAFILVPQGQDMIRVQAGNGSQSIGEILNTLFSFVAVILWAIQSWYGARVLLHASDFSTEPGWKKQRLKGFEQWIPRILGGLPFAVMIIAYFSATEGFSWEMIAYLVLWGVFFFFVIRRRKIMKRWLNMTFLDIQPGKYVFSLAFVWKYLRFALISVIAYTAILILFILSTVSFPQFLGAVAVICLALATWITEGCLLVYADKQTRLPLVLIVFLLLVVFSRVNNNHSIDMLPLQAKTNRPDLTSHFEKWLAERDTTSDEEAEPYPVFIIAAEGGGIRAAYWTAGILSAIQDQQPSFREHIYAVSSVSGGSLGAAIYLAMISDTLDNNSSFDYTAVSAAILGEDFLSPVVSSLVYPDLLQRILPLPIYRFDRARALEASWEKAWKEVRQNDQMSRGFLKLWDTHPYRVPAFFLNTTQVETGTRAIISNVRIGDEFGQTPDLGELTEYRTRLSTATLLSARFPFVTPGARLYHNPDIGFFGKWFSSQDDVWGHIVDGGYFENSGAATAYDILSSLESFERSHNIRLYTLVVKNDPKLKNKPMLWLNELREPPTSLLKARSARVPYSIDVIKNHLGEDSVIPLNMRASRKEVPLGWTLSLSARKRVEDEIEKAMQGESVRKILGLLRMDRK